MVDFCELKLEASDQPVLCESRLFHLGGLTRFFSIASTGGGSRLSGAMVVLWMVRGRAPSVATRRLGRLGARQPAGDLGERRLNGIGKSPRARDRDGSGTTHRSATTVGVIIAPVVGCVGKCEETAMSERSILLVTATFREPEFNIVKEMAKSMLPQVRRCTRPLPGLVNQLHERGGNATTAQLFHKVKGDGLGVVNVPTIPQLGRCNHWERALWGTGSRFARARHAWNKREVAKRGTTSRGEAKREVQVASAHSTGSGSMRYFPQIKECT